MIHLLNTALPSRLLTKYFLKLPLHYYFTTFLRLRKTEFQNRELTTTESLLGFVLTAVRIYRVNVGHGG